MVAFVEKAVGGGDKAGDGALHIAGAAADQIAVLERGVERVDRPVAGIARWHDIGVTGKAEVPALDAAPGIEVVDGFGSRFLKGQAVTRKAEAFQRLLQNIQRARIGGRHTGPTYHVGR